MNRFFSLRAAWCQISLGLVAAVLGCVTTARAQTDTTAPTVNITSPSQNSVVAALSSISGTAVDLGTGGGPASGLKTVTFQLVKIPLGTTNQFFWDSTNAVWATS